MSDQGERGKLNVALRNLTLIEGRIEIAEALVADAADETLRQKAIAYLAELRKALAKERNAMLGAIAAIEQSIAHGKDLISQLPEPLRGNLLEWLTETERFIQVSELLIDHSREESLGDG